MCTCASSSAFWAVAAFVHFIKRGMHALTLQVLQALEELETGKNKTMYICTNEETGTVDIMDVA